MNDGHNANNPDECLCVNCIIGRTQDAHEQREETAHSKALYAAVGLALHDFGNTLLPLRVLTRAHLTGEALTDFDEMIDRLFKADSALRAASHDYEQKVSP